MIPLKLAPEVVDDLRRLPSERARKVAFGWLMRLEQEPKLGQRLDWRGGLSNCRKLYFDEDDQPRRRNFQPPKRRPGGARFRIVYQLKPRDDRPVCVYVWAIGPKYGEGATVYKKAADRQDD